MHRIMDTTFLNFNDSGIGYEIRNFVEEISERTVFRTLLYLVVYNWTWNWNFDIIVCVTNIQLFDVKYSSLYYLNTLFHFLSIIIVLLYDKYHRVIIY